jgi:uncharacterized membrane protein affecting hemolysin expression
MTVQTTYRTCPRSGLQFEKQAEALMKINAVTAVVALLVGGLLAIGVVLTRTLLQGKRTRWQQSPFLLTASKSIPEEEESEKKD